MSPEAKVDQVVSLIERLGLVDGPQVGKLRELSAKCIDTMQLYRVLVQHELLTAYQANALARDQTDELLLGPYCILERLGQGSVSEVFKARHKALGRIVALKVINRKKLVSPETIQRFFAQAQIAAQLNHPNIVVVYDAGQDGDRCYYAMEYLQSRTLAQLVQQRGALPVPLACEYVRQAAMGLQHAADFGLTHGNVKPWNLVVHRDPQTQMDVVKVLDFGLAQLVSQGLVRTFTPAAMSSGALDYAAPECFISPEQVDTRADVYSLGATLYYLLTGRTPIAENDPARQRDAKIQGRLRPITELRPDVPANLVAILDKMLAVQPQDRYSCPGGVAQALAPFTLGAQPVSPLQHPQDVPDVPPALPIPPPSPRLFRPTRKNYIYLVLGLVLTFLLAVSLAVWLALKLTKFGERAAQASGDKSHLKSEPTRPLGPASPPTSKPEEQESGPLVPEIPPGVASALLQAPISTGKIKCLAVEPYGEKIAIVEEIGQLNVYNAADGKVLFSLPIAHDRGPMGISWRGSHCIAVVYMDGVEWRESRRGQVIGETRLNLSSAPPAKLPPQPVAYSPFTDILAFPWQKSLILTDSETQRYYVRKETPIEVLDLALPGRSGLCLMLTRQGLYKLDERLQRTEIPRPKTAAEALPVGALSPDGSWAALTWKSTSGSRPQYSIIAWSLSEAAPLVRITSPAAPQQLQFLPATQQLAALYAGTVIAIYDLPKGEMSFVVRSSGKMTKMASATLAPRLVVCGDSELYITPPLRDRIQPAVRPVTIISEPTDPPSSAAVVLAMPARGQEREARALLRQKLADLYAQLPKSRFQLVRELLEQGRMSQVAEEVVACGLEIAALCGTAGDLSGLDLGVKTLQDRLLATPEEVEQLLLEEFSRQNIPAATAAALVNRWERLVDTYMTKLDLSHALVCLRHAVQIAQQNPQLSAIKVPELERKISLYTKALEDKDKLQPALAALEKNPEDAQAHKDLGIFYIRRLEDYARGFRHLVRCNDAALVKLAQAELAGAKNIDEMVQLAEGWAQAGQGVQPDTEARWYYERAVHWFRLAYNLQMRENAVLAAVIAERWKKATARFADLPVPSSTGFILQQPMKLTRLSTITLSGDKLVCAGNIGDAPALVVLNVEDLKEVSRWNLRASVRWLEACHSESLVAVGLTDGSFLWLNVDQNNAVPKQVSPEGEVCFKGAFNHKTKRLLVLSSDKLLAFTEEARLAIQVRELSAPIGTGSPAFAVSPRGDFLVIGGKNIAGHLRLMLLDLEGRLLDSYNYGTKDARVPSLAFSSEGATLAVAWQKEVTLFRMPMPGRGEKLVPEPPIALPSTATAILANPHRGQFIVGLEDGNLALLDLQHKKVTVFKGLVNQPIHGLAVHAERQRVFVGYANGVIGVFALPPD